MGSDAQIYTFDYERYVLEVVPATKRLLLTGEFEPWWAQAIHGDSVFYGTERYGDETAGSLTSCAGLDLDRYCTYLGADLQLNEKRPDLYQAVPDEGVRYDLVERVCRSVTCPLRGICIFHADDTLRALEDFNNVLEIAVAVRCLGPGQFVGRSQSAGHFQEYLREVGVAEQDELHSLLERLAFRGFVVGYGFANGDGIHGWLTPDETVDLHTRLERLPLPRYAATFEVMQERFRQELEQYPRQPPFSFTPEYLARRDLEWLALSLSFVRTVAAIAIQSGHGVLWGNDLTEYRGGNGSSSEK